MDKFEQQAKALMVQREQLKKADNKIGDLLSDINQLNQSIKNDLEEVDNLLNSFPNMQEQQIVFTMEEDEFDYIDAEEYDKARSSYGTTEQLDNIVPDENWDNYLLQIEEYAKNHQINLNENLFNHLLSESEKIEFEKWIKEDFEFKQAKCDKYDYLISVTCGAIGGLVDIFLVGSPKTGYLTKFTDSIADESVKKFAKLCGWTGKKGDYTNTESAIGFLEKKFKVNYDHRHSTDVNNQFSMSTKNHHIKSLGHSPDLLGLFYSIYNQFTNTASFVDKGKIITIDTNNFELQGSNIIAKIFCGFVNWLGHLFSDFAGSCGSRTKNNNNRGSGIPIPFFSMLQFLEFGQFGKDRQTLATISVRVFQEGYDARFGMALAVPTIIIELLVRIMWVVKQHFYHKKDWLECVPSDNNLDLRRMLCVAHGTCSLIDIGDAAIRSGGNWIAFFTRTNILEFVRFGQLAYKEFVAAFMNNKLNSEAVDKYLNDEYQRLLISV